MNKDLKPTLVFINYCEGSDSPHHIDVSGCKRFDKLCEAIDFIKNLNKEKSTKNSSDRKWLEKNLRDI